MRSIKTVEHTLQGSERGSAWHPAIADDLQWARKLAFRGNREEALEEADRVGAKRHQAACRQVDHSQCMGFDKFSVLTVTKERCVIIDFESLLEAGEF